MKKKLIIPTIIIFIISSIFFYKHIELNKLKSKNYAIKIYNIAYDINQSARIIKYQPERKEYDMFKQQIITNLNSLGSALYTGSTLISGIQIDDYQFQIYTEKLYYGLQDNNLSLEIINILDNIINGTDILVKNFKKCYSNDSNITEEEITNSIQIALMNMF
ncbi:MAG: hypothetical protein KH415_11195 [Clostridium sp.]|nr:hypothetical protein [Clostridium sp.]